MSTSKFEGYLPRNSFVMGRRAPVSQNASATAPSPATDATHVQATVLDPAPDTATPAAAPTAPAVAVPAVVTPAIVTPAAALPPIAFGEGNPRAELIFVGGLTAEQGPGPNGPLLDKMIEAMGKKRADVFITPVLTPVDAVHCVERIGPKVVVALGKAAAQNLQKAPLPAAVQLISTYHPDEMVTNPSAKKECWEQLKIAMKTLGWKK
jgi:hypothetical protein